MEKIILLAILIFFVYLVIDFLKTGNINTSIDEWLKKTVWIWLPFVAFWRLIKEVFLQKK